jgi:hypothetical protein
LSDEPNTQYDWYNTFVSLKSQAKEGETEFATCLECVKEELEDFFDKDDMVAQGEAMDVKVIFVQCDKHAGARS